MIMRIVVSGALEKETLAADEYGINYNKSAGFGIGAQNRHAYAEIDAIVRTTANPALPVLSISIRYKANDAQHRATVDFIVQRAAQTKETP